MRMLRRSERLKKKNAAAPSSTAGPCLLAPRVPTFAVGTQLRKDEGVEHECGEIIAVGRGENPYTVKWKSSGAVQMCCEGDILDYITYYVNTAISFNKKNEDYADTLLSLIKEVNSRRSIGVQSSLLDSSFEVQVTSKNDEGEEVAVEVQLITTADNDTQNNLRRTTISSISSDATMPNDTSFSLLLPESPLANNIGNGLVDGEVAAELCGLFTALSLEDDKWTCQNCGGEEFIRPQYHDYSICQKCHYFLI